MVGGRGVASQLDLTRRRGGSSAPPPLPPPSGRCRRGLKALTVTLQLLRRSRGGARVSTGGDRVAPCLPEVLAGDGGVSFGTPVVEGGGRSAVVGKLARRGGRVCLESPGVVSGGVKANMGPPEEVAGGGRVGIGPPEQVTGGGRGVEVPVSSKHIGLTHPSSSPAPVVCVSPVRLGDGTDTSHCTSGPPRGGSTPPMSPVMAISPMLRITTSFATLTFFDLGPDLTAALFTPAQHKDPAEAPLTAPLATLLTVPFTATQHNTSRRRVFHQRVRKVLVVSAPAFTSPRVLHVPGSLEIGVLGSCLCWSTYRGCGLPVEAGRHVSRWSSVEFSFAVGSCGCGFLDVEFRWWFGDLEWKEETLMFGILERHERFADVS